MTNSASAEPERCKICGGTWGHHFACRVEVERRYPHLKDIREREENEAATRKLGEQP